MSRVPTWSTVPVSATQRAPSASSSAHGVVRVLGSGAGSFSLNESSTPGVHGSMKQAMALGAVTCGGAKHGSRIWLLEMQRYAVGSDNAIEDVQQLPVAVDDVWAFR